MGFAWLVNTREAALAFKAKYNIPLDVGIKYCPPKAIEDCRKQGSIVIPLITVIEGGVRFHLCPLLLQTLRFYKLSLDQCQPNFYRVVMFVDRLNRLFDLHLVRVCALKSNLLACYK